MRLAYSDCDFSTIAMDLWRGRNCQGMQSGTSVRGAEEQAKE